MIVIDDPGAPGLSDAEVRRRTLAWWDRNYVYRRYHTNEDGTVTVTEIPPEEMYETASQILFGFRPAPSRERLSPVRDDPRAVSVPTVASVVQAAIRLASGGGDSSVQPGGPPLLSHGPPGDLLRNLPRG